MFQHRLGLALGMTLGQIRAMPAPEYESWKLYYKVEPWGWREDEFRSARLLTYIYNSNVSTRSDAKQIRHFLRDPEVTIKEMVYQKEMRDRLMNATDDERSEMIAGAFAGMGIRAKVINGDSGNHSG